MSMTAVAIRGTVVLAMALPLSLQPSPPRTSINVSTDHLKLRAYSSEPTVVPGGRVSLVVEIEPRQRMHVYAPGANDYLVITLMVAPQPFVRRLPLRYPKPEIYVFERLNERVPVYQKPFTLVQDVILGETPTARTALAGQRQLALTGTLEYQACDDKVCFSPVSVPLSWTVAVRPLTGDRPGSDAAASRSVGHEHLPRIKKPYVPF